MFIVKSEHHFIRFNQTDLVSYFANILAVILKTFLSYTQILESKFGFGFLGPQFRQTVFLVLKFPKLGDKSNNRSANNQDRNHCGHHFCEVVKSSHSG